VPRPEELPEGCKYAGRCSYDRPVCEEKEPLFVEVSPEHYVRCVRTEEIRWSFSR
jgi:oligopeptide transport system ATP-binding protein